jgi:hypothetical protein
MVMLSSTPRRKPRIAGEWPTAGDRRRRISSSNEERLDCYGIEREARDGGRSLFGLRRAMAIE